MLLIMSLIPSLFVAAQTSERLVRTSPESEGVSSKYIVDFINAVDTGSVEIHSFMFIRHGKVVAEGWWKPYGPDYKHIMYSASKTFTATGIGLAVSENRLKLTDKVVSFFPASVPDTLSQYMKEMTVKDLLMMSTGQDAEPRRAQNDDWIRSFLSKAPVDKPGTVFRYNNTATFMLSAIVQQVTGMTLYDYLQPRLFRPLGIRGIDWDLNPQGINLGMIGLRLKTEDMAKFGQLLMQQGQWEGKQLLPKEWVAEATSFKIKSNGGDAKIPAEVNDWFQGYCYQMWRGRNNSVRLDGMAGQFVILLPDKDAVVVLTANAQNTQKEMDLVWNYLLPAIKSDKPLANDAASFSELQKRTSSLVIPPSSSQSKSSSLESRISGKTIEFQQNTNGIKEMKLVFSSNTCFMTFKRETDSFQVKAGMDSWNYSIVPSASLLSAPRAASLKSRDASYAILQPVIRVASAYAWIDNNLDLNLRYVEEALGAEGFVFRFSEKDGTLNVTLDRKSARTAGTGMPGMQRAPEPLTGRVLEK
jgi:CubicO group peptidase (beta-lactamase class C family)